jgi:EcoEI R protein
VTVLPVVGIGYVSVRVTRAILTASAVTRSLEPHRSIHFFVAGSVALCRRLATRPSQPHGKLQFKDIRALADVIHAPPRLWTPDLLWAAYEKLERDKVKGCSTTTLLTDIVSLVRFALHRSDELVPELVGVIAENVPVEADGRRRL